MFTFFRKYNKAILVVGGSLLMVAFLIEPALQQLSGNPADQVIGSVDGDDIVIGDLHSADAELALLRQLNPSLIYQLPYGNDAALTWLLMIREAQNHGLGGSLAWANNQLRTWKISQENILKLMTNNRVDEQFILRSLARFQMVSELQRLMVGARRVSDPQLEHFIADIQTRATVRAVVLDAEAHIDDAAEPTDKELQAHFDKYKAEAPGEDSSSPNGFGYRIPDRLKYEYIEVRRADVAATVKVDEIQASRYYYDHEDDYAEEAEDAAKDDADDKKDEDAAKEEAPKKIKPYKDVRESIIRKLKDDAVAAKTEEIIKWVSGRLYEQTRQLKMDEDKIYRVLPDGFEPMSLESVAKEVEAEFGVLPKVVRIENEWVELARFNEQSEIGPAYLEGSTRGRTDAEMYIGAAKEFDAKDNALSVLRLQANVPSQPVRDTVGNRFIFRLLAVEKNREPKNLDEVRARVRYDVRHLKAYETLKTKSAEYVASAREGGVNALGESMKVVPQTLGPFNRRSMNFQGQDLDVPLVPLVGRSEVFVDDVFEIVSNVQEEGGLAKADPKNAVGTVALDDQLKLIVVQVTNVAPADSTHFKSMKPFLRNVLQRMDFTEGSADLFTVDAIGKRVNFVRSDNDEDEEADGDEGEKAQS